jgi:hypothetical protein
MYVCVCVYIYIYICIPHIMVAVRNAVVMHNGISIALVIFST